jgi:hypothetical protein
MYTLTFKGMDIAGNSSRCVATVFVPHDKGQPKPPVTAAIAEEVTAQPDSSTAEVSDETVDPVTNPEESIAEESSDGGVGADTAQSVTQINWLYLPVIADGAAFASQTAQATAEESTLIQLYLPLINQ